MPSTEFVQEKETRHNVVLAEQYLKVFMLYSCPVCRRWTIHKPIVDEEGLCFVDHKRVALYQMHFDGSEDFVGFQAVDSCLVPGVHPVANIEKTRTVIRVK